MTKQPLLSIDRLKITGKISLTSQGKLALYPGEMVALLGENGVGKTTFALSIIGLLNKKHWTIQGKMDLKGKSILGLGDDQWSKIRGKDIGFVFQDPLRSFNPLKTIESHFLESIALHESLSKNQAVLKAKELLQWMELSETYLSAYPFQLSGGEGQRIAIALSLIHSPSLLILDEPTASLDQKGCDHVMTLLKNLEREKKIGILLISHDLNLIERYIDRALTVDQGVIQEALKPKVVFAKGPPSTRKPPKSSLLKTSDLGISFPQKTILSSLNFTLKTQEIVGIFGGNGIGKTTLAKVLVGLVPFTGQVLWQEKNVQKLSKNQKRLYAKSIQMVFQNPLNTFNPKMTVFESVMEGVRLHFPSLSDAERTFKIGTAFRQVSLNSSYGQFYPEMLSGGEIQKAAIARAVVIEPDLLILDEPTASLDQSSIITLISLIKGLYQNKNISFLIISHQQAFLESLCHRVFELKQGHLVSKSTFQKI